MLPALVLLLALSAFAQEDAAAPADDIPAVEAAEADLKNLKLDEEPDLPPEAALEEVEKPAPAVKKSSRPPKVKIRPKPKKRRAAKARSASSKSVPKSAEQPKAAPPTNFPVVPITGMPSP